MSFESVSDRVKISDFRPGRHTSCVKFGATLRLKLVDDHSIAVSAPSRNRIFGRFARIRWLPIGRLDPHAQPIITSLLRDGVRLRAHVVSLEPRAISASREHELYVSVWAPSKSLDRYLGRIDRPHSAIPTTPAQSEIRSLPIIKSIHNHREISARIETFWVPKTQ
jgi:hypothetical protein